MSLKKKSTATDVQTDDNKAENTAAPLDAAPTNSEPANEPAPTAESEQAAAGEVVEDEQVADVESDSKEVAAKPTATELAKPGSGNFVQQAADDGFEGVELGYFSFPTIKMPGEGIFESSTGVNLGKYVDVVITGSKPKYLIKPANAGAKDKRIAFSADAQVSIEGKTLADLKKEWGVDALDIKKYLDVPAKLISSDKSNDLDDQMVMLSVPPSAVQRFSGYLAELSFLGKGKPTQVITRCKVGAKITNDNGDFYPWLFECKGPSVS